MDINSLFSIKIKFQNGLNYLKVLVINTVYYNLFYFIIIISS